MAAVKRLAARTGFLFYLIAKGVLMLKISVVAADTLGGILA